MNKPALIRNFFEKIENASAAPAMPKVQIPSVEVPAELLSAETIEASSLSFDSFDNYSFNYAANSGDDYNPDCPPLTSRKSASARASFNDFGVGLPPLAGSCK